MILGKKEILKQVRKGNINITHLAESQIGPASIDLSLSNEFRINGKDVKKNKITLKPNQFILGITKEQVYLSKKFAGILTGRSRFARLGLQIHSTAPFIQPGTNNREVLELKNLSNRAIELDAGEKICQMIVLQVKNGEESRGRYKNQKRIII